MNATTLELSTLGYMVHAFQRSPAEITRALKVIGAKPAMVINGVGHYTAETFTRVGGLVQVLNRYDAELRTEIKANGGDRRKAAMAIARRDTELHKAYVVATQRTRCTAEEAADSRFS